MTDEPVQDAQYDSRLFPILSELAHRAGFGFPRPQQSLLSAACNEARDMDTAIMWLMHWLRYRHGALKERPRNLPPQHLWTKAMGILLDHTPELGKVFEIQNDELDFRSEVPSETRKQICKFVADTIEPGITFYD